MLARGFGTEEMSPPVPATRRPSLALWSAGAWSRVLPRNLGARVVAFSPSGSCLEGLSHSNATQCGSRSLRRRRLECHATSSPPALWKRPGRWAPIQASRIVSADLGHRGRRSLEGRALEARRRRKALNRSRPNPRNPPSRTVVGNRCYRSGCSNRLRTVRRSWVWSRRSRRHRSSSRRHPRYSRHPSFRSRTRRPGRRGPTCSPCWIRNRCLQRSSRAARDRQRSRTQYSRAFASRLLQFSASWRSATRLARSS